MLLILLLLLLPLLLIPVVKLFNWQQGKRHSIKLLNESTVILHETTGTVKHIDVDRCREVFRRLVDLDDSSLLCTGSVVATLTTFAVPTVSFVLNKSGGFKRESAKRHDDSLLIMLEIISHKTSDPRTHLAIERLNTIHGRFGKLITNDDMLFCLSLFMLEPMRWYHRFGWRDPLQVEEEANFHTWRWIGERMGIKDIPNSIDSLDKWADDYAKQHIHFSPLNRKVLNDTITGSLKLFLPTILIPFGRMFAMLFLPALLDDRTCVAFGLHPASKLLKMFFGVCMLTRAACVKYLSIPPEKPMYQAGTAGPDGPQGCLYYQKPEHLWHYSKETDKRSTPTGCPLGYHIQNLGTGRCKRRCLV